MKPLLDVKLTSSEQLSVVRRNTRTAANGCGFPGDDVDSIVNCVTELATNGITHGRGAVTVKAERTNGRFWLCVMNLGAPTDASRGRAQADTGAPPLAENGRGLRIVSRLMDLTTIVVPTALTTVWIVLASTPLPATADDE